MTNPPRILLVEDQNYARTRMRQTLEAKGYSVTAAATLNDAYAHVCVKDLPYAAILCDYNLGGRNRTGLELWQATRASRHSVPFIGSSSEMDYWQKVVEYGEDPLFHAIPKVDNMWDDTAILAKLAELNITP